MRAALRKIRDCYALYLAFGIWSGLCIAFGAFLMDAAIWAELVRRGFIHG